MLVRFNIDSPVVREVFADEVIPFGMISNNHAGQRKVVVQETPIRVVCAVAESVDHDAHLWRVRDSRAEAMLVGRLAEAKDRVLTSLVQAAGNGPRDFSSDFGE